MLVVNKKYSNQQQTNHHCRRNTKPSLKNFPMIYWVLIFSFLFYIVIFIIVFHVFSLILVSNTKTPQLTYFETWVYISRLIPFFTVKHPVPTAHHTYRYSVGFCHNKPSLCFPSRFPMHPGRQLASGSRTIIQFIHISGFAICPFMPVFLPQLLYIFCKADWRVMK